MLERRTGGAESANQALAHGLQAPPIQERATWRCRLLGHRLGFRAAGQQMVWECERGCGQQGSKQYATAEDAARFAAAFNRRDSDDLGRRAPLIGLLPLRLWRKLRDREKAHHR